MGVERPHLDSQYRQRILENREALADLAESDLPCAPVAKSLLELAYGEGRGGKHGS